MRTVGLIVEYNPLHNGHAYHFHESKKLSGADAAVCVMSGHFLQRGEPAIVNKWARAEMALAMGADLVLELPVAYAAQAAEWFAFGAVSTLEATGVVDALCFGSESGELAWLAAAAALLREEPGAFRARLKAELKRGLPYPSAYSRAVAAFVPGAEEAELAKPNNTLGLHYLLALERLGSRIQPLTIPRTAAGFHQTEVTDARIASATAIRKLLQDNPSLAAVAPFVPPSTLAILEREWAAGRGPMDWERYAGALLHQLLSRSPAQLAAIHEVTEGLEHRLRQALAGFRSEPGGFSVSGLLDRLKTKRYTRTKLQRALTRILLNHAKAELTADALRAGPPYVRVLGFGPRGRELLRRMKTAARVPVITKVTDDGPSMLTLDVQATGVYALGYGRNAEARDWFRDYYEPPVRR